jgi:glycerate kinase
MLDCRNRGCAEVVVCVGGSASTDGGAGLLTALGAKFLDSEGKTLVPGGGALLAIDGCDVGPLDSWSDISVSIAVDVENPLLGPKGAAAIFGPQKGADTAQVELLDRALTRFADVLEGATGRAVRAMPGTGAAGGTAFGLACGLGARIISGFDWIAALIELERKIAEADCVITAEGRLDSQSLFGKGIGGLARMCRAANKPLLAVPALVEEGIDWPGQGIAKVLAAALDGNAATLNDVSNAVSVLIS